MAYGKNAGKKKTDKRSAELARVPVLDGTPLSQLRERFIALCDEMASSVYPATISAFTDWDAIEKGMIRIQKRSPLNTMYKQEARMCVKDAISEQIKRRLRNLMGRMLNVATRPDKTGDKNGPVFVNVSNELTREIGEEEILRLSEVWGEMQEREEFYNHLITLIALSPDETVQTPEMRLLRHLSRKAEDKFRCPVWTGDGKDLKKARINIYPQTLRSGGAGIKALLQSISARFYSRPKSGLGFELLLTSPLPKGAGMSVKGRLSLKQQKRIESNAFGHGLEALRICLEIGETHAVLRLITGKERVRSEMRKVRFVVSNDLGLSNSAAISVIDLGREYTLSAARKAIASVTTKEQAKAYLEGRKAPDGIRVIHQDLFSAEGYNARMKALAQRIDGTSSEIDRSYAKIDRFKAALAPLLGLSDGDRIPEEPPAFGDANADLVRKLHRELFRALRQVAEMKSRRRQLYDQAAGVKRSWIGLLTSHEVRLARQHNAVIVRENLTFVTPERGAADYKGRTFNKLINHASRGQHARKAAEKADYAGVPLLLVPSYYTSSYDYEAGVVNKGMRRGHVFTAMSGEKRHADLNASIVIGLWAFLTRGANAVRNVSLNGSPVKSR